MAAVQQHQVNCDTDHKKLAMKMCGKAKGGKGEKVDGFLAFGMGYNVIARQPKFQRL